MEPRFLILETSQRLGQVAVAAGAQIIGARTLDESRRHARDLVPVTQELLRMQGWRARDLDAVIVSRGPGSYTGLRVGMMSAKTLAFATGCALLVIDTFAAVYQAVSERFPDVEVIADAQQDKIYVQNFGKRPVPLAIVPCQEWMERPGENRTVTGPGLEIYSGRLPATIQVLPGTTWLPKPASLLELGLRRFRQDERDDPFGAEPLYLRPSSAEEKWHTPGSGLSARTLSGKHQENLP